MATKREPIVDAFIRKFQERIIKPAKQLGKEIQSVDYMRRAKLGKKIIPEGFYKSREFFDSNSELSRKIQEILRRR